MPNYRRRYTGQHVFSTVVTAARKPLFRNPHARSLLRESLDMTCAERPWKTLAMVLLPDHMHMLWELPEGDVDYSRRVSIWKKRFTRRWLASNGSEAPVPAGQQRRGLRGVWQQKFWEHTIRDVRDYARHVDYIHANPAKHELVAKPIDWPWSTFHDYVKRGLYEPDWIGLVELPCSSE